MDSKWQMAFIGLLVSLFLGWAGWVSLTLIQRSEIIVEVRSEIATIKQQVPTLFKLVYELGEKKLSKEDHDD